jgi:hypothetical protein
MTIRKEKRGEAKNYMYVESLREACPTFDPMLAHGIQLLQCRLSTLFPIYLIKHVEIWLDFLYVRVHITHGIVLLLVRDIMCALGAPNIFTIPLKNRQLAQQNFFYYVVMHCKSIHIIGT